MQDFSQNANDDRILLKRYAEQNTERAFSELVDRYSGLVYGTALRKTQRDDWAADITQNVFAALAKKSETLIRKEIPSIGAWLHRATTFESQRVMRDHLRAQRRNVMVEENINLNTSGDDSDVWREIRPVLDDALEKLPSKDRDILVLHYFDDLKFHEIAQRLGIRADAAQKRGTRALAKLSRLLGARRGTVTVAVIAGALSAELSKAAPASLVTKITTAAGAAGSATILSIMTASNKAMIASALGVLTISLGTGYLVGDRSSGEKNPEGSALAVTKSSRPDKGSRPALDPNSVLSDGTALTPHHVFVSQIKVLIEERERLMRELEELYQAGALAGDLKDVMRKLEGIFEEALVVASPLGGGDVERTLRMVGNLKDDQRIWATMILLHHWATIDPHAAIAVAKSVHSNEARSVYRGWGSSDPKAALAYQQETASIDQVEGRIVLAGVFEGWVTEDPAAAVNALELLGYDDQKTVIGVIDRAAKRESRRPLLLAAIAQVQDEALRTDLVSEVGEKLAQILPQETMSWFDGIVFENPRMATRAAGEIFEKVIQGGQTANAVDWFWPRVPEERRAEFVSRFVTGKWASEDQESAEKWLLEQGYRIGALKQ